MQGGQPNPCNVRESAYDAFRKNTEVKIRKDNKFMGRVSAFLGMVLYMYPEKNGRHNRPHIHVMYGDDECVLSIPGGVGRRDSREAASQRSDIY